MVAEANELREQLDEIDLPEEVRRQADRELQRLERLPPAAAEHGVIRSYLEWIASLPWDKTTEDNLDLGHARTVLDADHYDIEPVKERILEFLAVRKLKPDARGSILCFVGPPGVGKTSLGRSIARALGREFERISAGGVRDEAEIRGHRRTYVGAMPGVIVRALRDAGSRNPLFMIDEIDKMGADFRGDPASAMLEVLDPEQNSTFRDHYLDVPFDLSSTMFITTANELDRIPVPLRDRMEVLALAGYTEQEKLEIAKRYLVPRQIERNGLTKSRIAFSDAALRTIIAEYTREAGVRNLEREVGSVCRKVARQVAEGAAPKRVSVSGDRVRELLGKPRFRAEVKRRTREPGVATGLAWTPAGRGGLVGRAPPMSGPGQAPPPRPPRGATRRDGGWPSASCATSTRSSRSRSSRRGARGGRRRLSGREGVWSRTNGKRPEGSEDGEVQGEGRQGGRRHRRRGGHSIRAAAHPGLRAARQPQDGVRLGTGRLRPDQRQGAGQAARRQEAPEGAAERGERPEGRQRRAARGAQAAPAAQRRLRVGQAAVPRGRRDGGRARRQRGPAQQGPRCALRRGGGVRLPVDDGARPAAADAGGDRLLRQRAPTRRPQSFRAMPYHPSPWKRPPPNR